MLSLLNIVSMVLTAVLLCTLTAVLLRLRQEVQDAEGAIAVVEASTQDPPLLPRAERP